MEKQYLTNLYGVYVKDEEARESIELVNGRFDEFNDLTNPNLLINSDFRQPINQRGATNYTSTSAKQVYTIDRWKLHDAGSLTVNDGFISFNGTGLKQWIEMPKFIEQSYTLSVKCKDKDVKVFNFNNYDGSYKEISVDGFKCAMQYAPSMKALMVIMWNGVNAIEVEWCKLEQGKYATPFVPRPYGEELALCQRYYQVIVDNETMFKRADIISNDVIADLLYPCEMRTKPTVISYEVNAVSLNNSSYVAAGVLLAQSQKFFRVSANATIDCIFQIKNVVLDAEIY